MTATAPTPTAHPLGHPWPINRAAEALSITPRFLRALIAEGSIRSINLGRRVLVPDAEMRRVMAEGVDRSDEEK